MADKMNMALRLAQEGRTEGYKALYENTVEQQLTRAITFTGNTAQAQMVVQQAYQYIFDQITQIPQVEVFRRWLSDIVAYYAVMQLREDEPDAFTEAENPDFRLEDDDMSITEPLDDAEVLTTYVPEEIETMTSRILSTLTEAEKICVLMHYQDRRSVAQVAEAVGCTEQIAENLIASGKKKLLDAEGHIATEDSRVRWQPLPFVLTLLRLKAANLVTSGIAGTLATFQIAGNAVVFGAAGITAGTAGAAGMAAGNGVAGAAGMAAGNGAVGAAGQATDAGTAIESGMMSGGAADAGTAMESGMMSGGAADAGAGSAATAGLGAAGAGTTIGSGLLHTLGAKILIGVAAAAVVGGTIGGIAAYRHSQNEKKSAEVTATSTDVVEVPTTEATSETTTEEVTTEAAVDESYKQIYLQVLKEHEANIRDYSQYWQPLDSEEFETNTENHSIALSDVTGDDVPELLFVEKSPSSEEYVEYGALNIFTVENGAAKQIYYVDHWDTQVAGGDVYALFQIEGETTLYSCNGMQDEMTNEDYSRYNVQPDGMLQEEPLMSRHREPNEDYTGTIDTCTIGGQSATPEEFQAQLDALTSRMSKLLIYNCGAHDDNANAAMIAAEADYLTYEEAVALLSDGQQIDVSQGTTTQLPFTEAQSFSFMSGAGGWSTELTINPDGSFTGNYYDSDMGDSGDGYDGTEYVSTFHGKFKNIRKKDDYTYVMQIDTLETEETQDTWIEETGYGKVRYVASEPYGLYGGTNFELYLPGTPVSSLSAEYIDWVRTPMALDESATTLPGYGFYNVEEQNGFFGDWQSW